MPKENLLVIRKERFMETSPLLNYRGGELHVVEFKIVHRNYYPEISIVADVYYGHEMRDELMVRAQLDEIARCHDDLKNLVRWNGRNVRRYRIEDAVFLLGWYGLWGTRDGRTLPDIGAFKKLVNWGVIDEPEPPEDWLATNHPLLQNHANDLEDRISSFLYRHPEFAYLQLYVDEAAWPIRDALEARFPAVVKVMLEDVEAFCQQNGYEPGYATELLRRT